MTRIGLVGLGGMGSRIGSRLLALGHDVAVWNRSIDRAAPLVAQGAIAASSPARAASGSEVLLTMLTDSFALESVTNGPAGIAAGAHEGLLVIEMSTVGPEAIDDLRSWLPAGAGLVDAPVLGSLSEAESGSLVVFVGGSQDDVVRAEPILSALGSVIRTGSLGTGAAAKLVANSTLFTSLAALGESVAFARSLGLADAVTFDVLARTPLATQSVRRREVIESGETELRFRLSLAVKDADLIAGAADKRGLALPLVGAARDWLLEADARGSGGDPDYTVVLGTILAQSFARPRHESGDDARAAGDGEALQDGHAGSGELAPSTRAPVNSDGLILDLDGVVWRSGEPIAGAAEAIAEMRNGGARIVFVTNDPGRSPEEVALSLTRIGIPANADDVVTAADAVAELLVLRAAPVGRVLVLGPEPLRRRLLEADFDLAVPDDGGPVDVVVIGGHERFDYGELRAASSAVLDGAELIATSRDALYPTATGRWPATGAVVAAVEAATGTRATIAGKPSPTIFELARDRLGMPGGGTTRHLAVVGDHLEADIAGGAGAGLDTVLVLTGIATAGDVEEARVRPDLVVASLAVFAQLRRQQGID